MFFSQLLYIILAHSGFIIAVSSFSSIQKLSIPRKFLLIHDTALHAMKKDVWADEIEPISIQVKKSDVKATWKDYAILALVPLIWGTYSPLIKYIYDSSSGATPPPLIFNALSYIVSFIVLSIGRKAMEITIASTEAAEIKNVPRISSPSPIRAGLELGMYLFIGSTLQLQGLQSTSPIKAGVLVQCTTIIVPILDATLSKNYVPLKSIFSCVLATIGIFVLSWNQSTNNLLSIEMGDLLILASAVFYSLHVVRLGALVGNINAFALSQAKSFMELTLCITALGITLATGNAMEYINYFTTAMAMPFANFLPLIAVITWNGALATALTQLFQSFGQKSISPTTANLIYSSQPLWSAFFSITFLRETVSPQTLTGSIILMIAILSAIVKSPYRSSKAE